MRVKIEKIIIMMALCLISFIGCSNTSNRAYYKRVENSRKSTPNRNPLKMDRIDLYDNYKKDNLPIANPIQYLKYVNDMESPRTPFKRYSESEFLAFYKNTRAKGNGDTSNYWRWKLTLTKKEMSNVLNKNLVSLANKRPKEVLTYSNGQWISKKIPLNPIGDVTDIKILQRGKSGLVIKIMIKGSRGQYIVAKEGNIRALLGVAKRSVNSTVNIYGAKGGTSSYLKNPILKNPSLLPSAFLAIEKLGNASYRIYGGGFGHGAGIPQWAAMDLTQNKNYSYKKVLERYYADTKLRKINSISGLNGKLRVGIMTTGFATTEHTKVSIYSLGSIKIKSKDGSVNLNPKTNVDFVTKNGFTQVIVGGKLRLKTKNHINITSNKMISLTNIKRNVKNYKSPTYRGSFEIRLTKNGTKLYLINEIDIEDYLLQVVPSEMPKSFGLEALKVQTVAARTYAAKDMLRDRYGKSGFHILDSSQSQVYNNLDENDLAAQAVKATKGLILVHENKPIDAKYYSTSSGFNSNAHNVW